MKTLELRLHKQESQDLMQFISEKTKTPPFTAQKRNALYEAYNTSVRAIKDYYNVGNWKDDIRN